MWSKPSTTMPVSDAPCKAEVASAGVVAGEMRSVRNRLASDMGVILASTGSLGRRCCNVANIRSERPRACGEYAGINAMPSRASAAPKPGPVVGHGGLPHLAPRNAPGSAGMVAPKPQEPLPLPPGSPPPGVSAVKHPRTSTAVLPVTAPSVSSPHLPSWNESITEQITCSLRRTYPASATAGISGLAAGGGPW